MALQNVRQMTDAELRRALDYSLGDVVKLFKYDGQPQGIISSTKLTRGNNLMYVIEITSENGIKFVLARNDEIAFIRHGDEETY